MREMTKILLSACTVCALGQAQHTARADNQPPDQSPPQQVPPEQTPSQAPQPQPPPIEQTPPSQIPDTTEGPVAPPPREPSPQPAPVVEPAPVAEAAPPDMYSYAWSEPGLQSGIGVSTILGGGVSGFTDSTMRDTTSDLGGLWDLRVTIGSHVPLALDLSYVGTATSIDGLPGTGDSTLIGTALEGAVRFNILPHYAWCPYVFAGAGWQRYDVTGDNDNVSLAFNGMNDHDNLLEFPLGAGVAFRDRGFVFDLRGTFRATTDEDMVLETAPSPTGTDFASMHTWEASAALGYEF